MAIIYESDIALPRNPTEGTHAATKNYVDSGLTGKADTTHTHTAAQVTSILATAAPVAVNTAAAVGTATLAARSDHVHALTFTTTVPAALGTAAVGTSLFPARSDHVHAKPTYTAADVGATPAAHATTTNIHVPAVVAADTGKVLTAGAAGAVPTWETPSAGVTLATAAPVAVGTVAAVGAGTTAARADHVHILTFIATVPTLVGGIATSTVGTSLNPSRSDHTHALSFTTTVPAALGTAAVGTSTFPARSDHVHALPTPAAIGAVPTADLTTHANLTTAHSATATPTASRIAMYNASAKLVSTATVAADAATVVATKGYVDGLTTGFRGTVTGNGTLTDIPVTHGLNSQEVMVSVYKNATPPIPVMVQWTPTSATQITLSFAVAPATTDTYIVKVKV